jgi:two-component system, sensor histidine kinase and response regulator
MKTKREIRANIFPGAPAKTPTPPPYSPRILLADGDSYTRSLNARVLTWFGYRVQTVASGTDAWSALDMQNYDLLITENELAELTGVQLLKSLRSRGVTMPVIMASGKMPTKELKRHPGLRLEATLRKPVAGEKLLRTVQKILQKTEQTTAGSRRSLFSTEPWLQSKAANGTGRAGRTGFPKRILFVDDEPMMRQLHKEVLTDFGYAVEVAEDGAVAWNALQLQKYDLIITDNEMPKVSGIQLLEKLHAAQIALPVIMVSGTMPTEELQRKNWLPVRATLHKPYVIKELLCTVRNVLGTSDSCLESDRSLRAKR